MNETEGNWNLWPSSFPSALRPRLKERSSAWSHLMISRGNGALSAHRMPKTLRSSTPPVRMFMATGRQRSARCLGKVACWWAGHAAIGKQRTAWDKAVVKGMTHRGHLEIQTRMSCKGANNFLLCSHQDQRLAALREGHKPRSDPFRILS